MKDHTNKELKKLESNDKDSQQNRNTVSNETMSTPSKRSVENNNIQLATVNNDVEGNKILDNTTSKDDDTASTESHVSNPRFQSIISMENVPMYSVRKPMIKVNKQEIKPIKYDIITTVKNKSHIDKKNVL